jgi:biotin carboxyl carrier protein
MYKTLVSGKTFEIEPGGGAGGGNQWIVNGDPLAWDVRSLGGGNYHIIYRDKGFQAEVVKVDRANKTVDLKINGTKYSVHLRDKLDLVLEKLGIGDSIATKVNVIKAPMPGLIIDLRIKAGDAVKAGDPLLVLEAMKMENIIKSPGDGSVKRVNIKKGDSVEKNQVLIEF